MNSQQPINSNNTSLIKQAKISLDNTGIKNSPDSNFDIISSPGNGRRIFIEKAILNADFRGGIYGNVSASTTQLAYVGSTEPATTSIENTLFSDDSDIAIVRFLSKVLDPDSWNAYDLYNNKGIFFNVASALGPMTLGHANNRLKVS